MTIIVNTETNEVIAYRRKRGEIEDLLFRVRLREKMGETIQIITSDIETIYTLHPELKERI